MRVDFDDWMFLQPDGVLLNRAKIGNFGFNLGGRFLSVSRSYKQGF